MNFEIKNRWKVWAVGALLLLIAIYTGRLVYRNVTGAPPADVSIKTCNSPALDRGSAPDLAWNRFRFLLDESQHEATKQQKPLVSLIFLELTTNPKEAIAWTTETLTNLGFEPKSNFERPFSGRSDRFIGYYDLDGRALSYTKKQDLVYAGSSSLTLHLRNPLPVHGSTTVFRRQYQSIGMSRQTNVCTIGFGRLPDVQHGIFARGVRLPDRAVLVKYLPTQTFVATNGAPMIGWINTYLPDRYQGLTVTFTLPK